MQRRRGFALQMSACSSRIIRTKQDNNKLKQEVHTYEIRMPLRL